MMGIGPVEILVILVITLIVVGPEKMPEMARALARVIRDLRNAMDDVREQFNEFTREDLLGTDEINTYYHETIDSVKKSIEPPPDLQDIPKELEDSVEQIKKMDDPKPEGPPTQPSP